MQSRTIKILVTAAIVLGGAGMLVYSSLGSAEFYKHVHEVMAEPDAWVGKSLKIHGFVEAGSIHQEIVDQKTTRTFVLHSSCPDDEKVQGCKPGVVKRILVSHEGPVPDTFKELAEVVARGTLTKEGGQYVLHADEIMAKCPSKYKQDDRPSTYGKN